MASSIDPNAKDKLCPSCSKPIEDYHEYCPWCDVLLISDQKSEEKDETTVNSAPAGEPDLTNQRELNKTFKQESSNPQQPNCLSPKSDESTIIPNADSSLQVHSDNSLVSIQCEHCRGINPWPSNVCGYCGKAFSITTPGSVLQNPAIISSVINNMDVARHEFHLPGGATKTWSCQDPIPIVIYGDMDGAYAVSEYNVIHFRVQNKSVHTILELTIELTGHLSLKPLIEKLPVQLQPGSSCVFNIPGFFPAGAGKDCLRMKIDGKTTILNRFHLTGSVPINVFPKEDPITHVNISVNAETQMGDQEIHIPEFRQPGQLKNEPRMPNLSPIFLSWDVERQNRQNRYFPPACIGPVINLCDPKFLKATQCVSPEEAPRAVLSTPQGLSYFLTIGNTLLLGRDPNISHVDTAMYPKEHFLGANKSISRLHCRIMLTREKAYLEDSSSNGTLLGTQRLIRNKSEPVSDGDVIRLSNGLEFFVRLYTDGHQIIYLKLTRKNNKRNFVFLLACAPIAIGSSENLPIELIQGAGIEGFLYYHPFARDWYFGKQGPGVESNNDTKLDDFQEILINSSRIWFHCIDGKGLNKTK